jgi:hypothetical protein
MPETLPQTLNWKILADWDHDGTFVGPSDDISDRIDIRAGIRATRGRDPARSLGEPRIPSLEMRGVNHDRFFSNDFPGSPIYQMATQGVPVLAFALVGQDYDATPRSMPTTRACMPAADR